jgi:hypothetical protein
MTVISPQMEKNSGQQSQNGTYLNWRINTEEIYMEINLIL